MHWKLFISVLFISISFIVSLFLNTSEVKAEERLYYIHSDHLGSVTLVTDEYGNPVSQQSYYPYGETRDSTSNMPTERAYTGQVSDQKQTNLYYYNARYYNPLVAKFTQADEIEGPNRYTYVDNNPVKNIDFTGNQLDAFGEEGGSKSDSDSGLYYLPLMSRVSSNNSSNVISGTMIENTYYPQGFSGCSTGPGWATAGNCGPPKHPDVDIAPTYVLGGFIIGLPLASTYGQWLFYDFMLNGSAGYTASELSQVADDVVLSGDDLLILSNESLESEVGKTPKVELKKWTSPKKLTSHYRKHGSKLRGLDIDSEEAYLNAAEEFFGVPLIEGIQQFERISDDSLYIQTFRFGRMNGMNNLFGIARRPVGASPYELTGVTFYPRLGTDVEALKYWQRQIELYGNQPQ